MILFSSMSAQALDTAKLAQVLGAEAAQWTLNQSDAQLNRATLFANPGKTLNLENPTVFPVGTEYVATFRLDPEKGKSGYIYLSLGCKELPDKTVQCARLGVNMHKGAGYVGYSYGLQGFSKERDKSVDDYFWVNGAAESNLAWPDDFRRMMEAQIAAQPKIEEFTLRCTVEPGRIRGWLNGRYMGEMALPAEMKEGGALRVLMGGDVQLLAMRAQALPAQDSRFETLLLDENLTGSTIAGEKIDPAALPEPGKPAMIGGVPFYFPATDARGNNHIDVGTSWTRFGALSGWLPANSGLFGGRWFGASRLIDSSRITLYVPRGSYKTLHLIAAADGEANKVPIVTAQFYRPTAGHPINFAARVPEFKAEGAGVVKLPGGGQLYHVVIPLDPGEFDWFSDLDRIGLEITKEVKYFRNYPDPMEFSWHGAGLPSSVRIYAMSLERADVDVSMEPTQVAHVWTAPAKPGYKVTLRNNSATPVTADLEIRTRSHDGKDASTQTKKVQLPAGNAPVDVPVAFNPKLYGLHAMDVVCTINGKSATYQRNFAYLHPDTRERGNWELGRGGLFGYWAWGGGHDTPDKKTELIVMGQAGAETSTHAFGADKDPEIVALATKWKMLSEAAFNYSAMYIVSGNLGGKFDRNDREGTGKLFIETLKKDAIHPPSPLIRPTHIDFFPETHVMPPLTFGIHPHHYNGPEYVPTAEQMAGYNHCLDRVLIYAPAVRKEWPNIKILVPYGDPQNTAVFLSRSPETRGLIDGMALDMPNFERIPEQQIHQVAMHRLYPILKDIKEHIKEPFLTMNEGTHISSKDIDMSEQAKGDITVRNFLLLMGYDVYRHPSANAPFECAGYWGENHYGGGHMSRKPKMMPEIAYVGYATMTRQLNRANFTKYIPVGSTSTYCQQYKHYKTGDLVHVFWTIRGTRPVTLKVDPGIVVKLYDQNDNAVELKETNGRVTFTIDTSPCYLQGLKADAVVTLGESDHSDSQPATEITQLGNLGDGTWKQIIEEDLDYTKNKPLMIERFQGNMCTKRVEVPEAQGGQALAVHLEEQEIERNVMPYYTTFQPKEPIVIPGKASDLGLWVHAASDWGRVVYVLRDAKNVKWVSVGTKEEWNNDDIHCWSAFCFDGWRYLRFQLPGSSPYDNFREHGTAWWGAYGGDGVVELPLKIEKIIVERRPKVMYGNSLVAAKHDDVLLANLYAEYATPEDKTEEAVKLSKVRMTVPANAPQLTNPIAELTANGIGEPPKITKVADPLERADGTVAVVEFTPVPNAKSYDVWVSPYADGRGAMCLGKGWTESGKSIHGMRPKVPFYAFVVYTDAEGKASKPSAPFQFSLNVLDGYR